MGKGQRYRQRGFWTASASLLAPWAGLSFSPDGIAGWAEPPPDTYLSRRLSCLPDTCCQTLTEQHLKRRRRRRRRNMQNGASAGGHAAREEGRRPPSRLRAILTLILNLILILTRGVTLNLNPTLNLNLTLNLPSTTTLRPTANDNTNTNTNGDFVIPMGD